VRIIEFLTGCRRIRFASFFKREDAKRATLAPPVHPAQFAGQGAGVAYLAVQIGTAAALRGVRRASFLSDMPPKTQLAAGRVSGGKFFVSQNWHQYGFASSSSSTFLDESSTTARWDWP